MAQVITYEPSQPLVAGNTYSFPAFLFQTANSQNIKQIPTLAVGDVKISVDGSGYTDISVLPIEVGATGELTVSLTALETTGATKYITVKFHDVSGSEWTDTVYQIDVDTQETIDLDNLDVSVSSRLPTSSYVAPDNLTISSISSAVGFIPTNPLLTNDLRLNNLDAPISTMLTNNDPRLEFLDDYISSRSTLTASDVWTYVTRELTNTGITPSDVWAYATRELTGFGFTVETIKDLDIDAIKAKTDNLPINPASQTNLDISVSSRLAGSSYVAPDNATIVATKTIVDNIPLNPVLSTDPRLNALDTTISSRSTLTSNEVWSNTIRTLTSGGGSGGATPTEIWAYPTRTITGASGLASSIWEYEDRTLTGWRQIVIDIWNAIPSWLVKRLEQYVESDYSLYKGVTNEISIVSNVKLMGASNIVFSVKNKSSDSDDKAILRIESLNGLVTMNGGQYPTSTDGQIVTFDENTGSIKIILSSNASDEIIPSQKRLYDIKVKVGDEVKLISRGKIDLLPDITNTI